MITGSPPRVLLALSLALALFADPVVRSQSPALDAGAAGAWQKIRKLQTTASVMHTTAHPDDEHGGLLQIGALLAGTAARPAAVVAQTIMAVLTLGYIVMAVRSFVRARRA